MEDTTVDAARNTVIAQLAQFAEVAAEQATMAHELAGTVALQIRRPSSGTSSRQIVLMFANKKVRITSRPGKRDNIAAPLRRSLAALKLETAGDEVNQQPKMRNNVSTACELLGLPIWVHEWPAAVKLTSGNALWASFGLPDGRISARDGDLRPFLEEHYAAMEFKTDKTGKEPVSWRQALDAIFKLAKRNGWKGAVLVICNLCTILAVMEFVPAAGTDGTTGTVVVHTAAAAEGEDTPAPRHTDCTKEDEVDDIVAHMIHYGTSEDFEAQMASGLRIAHACIAAWRHRTALAATGGAAASAAPAPAAGAAAGTR